MTLRKVFIYIMVATLSAMGVLAAISVFRGHDSDWRLWGTGIASAAATALMLPFSTRADRPTSRFDGIAGMALVFLVYCCSLLLIWKYVEDYFNSDVEWKCWQTLGYVGAVGLPTILKLSWIREPANRVAGIFGLTVSLIVFPLYLWSVWKSDEAFRVFYTAVLFSTNGLLVMMMLFGLGERPRRYWRWIGVLAALFASSIWLADIWRFNARWIYRDEWLRVASLCIAGAVAHSIVCMLVPLRGYQHPIRVIAMLAAWTTTVSISINTWGHQHSHEWPMLEQYFTAAAVMACSGTLSLLLLARLNLGLTSIPLVNDIKQITVICPGCRQQQDVSTGQSHCIACGLKFKIHVEEPRCPQCNYLLYMLNSKRCPECGWERRNEVASVG